MRKLLLLALSLLPASARAQSADPLAPLLAFARQQPNDIAVFTAAVRPDGTPDPAKPVLSWNAAQPMPLASTRKIVVLAAYARAVAAGKLDPQTPVKLAEWEAYYLPGLDGGAHPASLEALKIPADAQGRAQDGRRTVPLDTVARFMVETSDNAATDLLLTRLGQGAIPDTLRALGLTGQENFGPISGLFNAWDDPALRATYAAQPLAQRVADSWTRAARVSQTPALRDPDALSRNAPPLDVQARQADTTDTRGTVNDYAGLLARVLTGAGLGKTELEVMRRHLGWPMRVNPGNAQAFTQAYAKGGSLSGVLTDNFAFQPKVGPRKGENLVVSVFLRRIPEGQYAALQENLETAMLYLAILPEQAQRLVDVLKASRK
ncbi:hypothetical protein Dcar01_03113 [Deinococcus carri]|uniref:Beta-lactamase class A catalytic domain-containing protein n=1 Tax=Deinococcus carri TaxID=1211323 RepID=A0ABP9WE36_9DEIO